MDPWLASFLGFTLGISLAALILAALNLKVVIRILKQQNSLLEDLHHDNLVQAEHLKSFQLNAMELTSIESRQPRRAATVTTQTTVDVEKGDQDG